MNQFSFFESYHRAIRMIEDPMEQLKAYQAITSFMFDDEDPELDGGMSSIVMTLILPTLQKSKTRAESGKLGGEISKQKANEKQNGSKTEANPKQTPPMEKDKEKEKEKDIQKDFCPERSPGRSSEPQPVIAIPLNDGTEHGVTEAEIEEYKKLYPAVDVLQELRNMRGWSNDNPTRRKTKSGVKRFIGGWLSKEQNRGRASPGEPQEKNRFNRFPKQEYNFDELKQKLVSNG